MDRTDILYDHYKDTFEQQKRYLVKRDRFTTILMVLAILLIGLIFEPTYIGDKLNAVISAHVDKLVFDFQFINTGLIIAFFWFSLQYYLILLQIEKMYTYLDECESRLSSALTFNVNREGAYYLKSYPWLKVLANQFFVIGIPLGFIVLSICKVVSECHWTSKLCFVDVIFLILTSRFSLLYISSRKCYEEYFDKEKYPDLGLYTRLKRYFKN